MMKQQNNFTILIKTFNRKRALIRLLLSIEKYYPNAKIVIVDDSKHNYKKIITRRFKGLDIGYLVTRYDIGLSEGRNILLNNTKTDYLLLCDDDFVFDDRTDIRTAISLLSKNDLDILGGMVHNRIEINGLYSLLWTLKKPSRIATVLSGKEFNNVYNGKYKISEKNISLFINNNANDYSESVVYRTDICSNFFVAKTEMIKKMGGWQPESLKVGEHEIFFLRAKTAGLKVAFTPVYSVNHYPKKTLLYMKYRSRQKRLFEDAWKDMGYKKFDIVKQGGRNA